MTIIMSKKVLILFGSSEMMCVELRSSYEIPLVMYTIYCMRDYA